MSDNDKQKVQMAQAVKFANENWPAMLDLIAFQAREARARYLAYVREGFTEAQAIELCRGKLL